MHFLTPVGIITLIHAKNAERGIPMKKTLSYIGGAVLAILGAYAAIRLITKKRFKEQDFTEDSENEDIFEDTDTIDEDRVFSCDTTGDGKVDSYMMDTTGDGQIDTVLLDTTGDGEIDTVLTDTTGDGDLDTVFTDLQ